MASVLSKIIENILLDRLSSYLTTNPNQFGFKAKHGTDMCIYSLKEIINTYKYLNGCIFTCFLDASKAFDRVKHSVLFKKLINRGAPGYIVKLLIFWYSHQTMCVRWGGGLSSKFMVSNGVRQGGILSPYLFNVYMDDLSNALDECNTGCLAGDKVVNHLMYADDLVLICPSAIGLSKLLQICEQYGIDHDIKFNSKKSAILICRNSFTKDVSFPVFTISSCKIEESTSVKYLGHFITNDMKDDKDIMRQCRLLYVQGNMLLRKFYMCSSNVKVTLFRAYCISMYTPHLWWNYTNAAIRKLYVAYNNAFRMLLKMPRDCSASGMFAENNVPSCQAVIRNLIFRFMTRLDSSSNTVIRAILDSDIMYNSRIRCHWRSLLYVNTQV